MQRRGNTLQIQAFNHPACDISRGSMDHMVTATRILLPPVRDVQPLVRRRPVALCRDQLNDPSCALCLRDQIAELPRFFLKMRATSKGTSYQMVRMVFRHFAADERFACRYRNELSPEIPLDFPFFLTKYLTVQSLMTPHFHEPDGYRCPDCDRDHDTTDSTISDTPPRRQA